MPEEICPGCAARLPASGGPTHRYIGASPACWEIYSALVNGGEPPLAPSPYNGLLVDAYAAQHPGVPSPQAVQSVAVHLLVLYGVLSLGENPGQALWIRRQALSEAKGRRQGRFQWLEPPGFEGALTIADVAWGSSAEDRARLVRDYVQGVWERWQALHAGTVAGWYRIYVSG